MPPVMDTYTAEVTVTVKLVSAMEKGTVVGEYTVTRQHTGPSARPGVTPPAELMSKVVEDALLKSVSAEKALRAGLANAEARRLK